MSVLLQQKKKKRILDLFILKQFVRKKLQCHRRINYFEVGFIFCFCFCFVLFVFLIIFFRRRFVCVAESLTEMLFPFSKGNLVTKESNLHSQVSSSLSSFLHFLILFFFSTYLSLVILLLLCPASIFLTFLLVITSLFY